MRQEQLDALKPGDRVRLADGRVGRFFGRGDHLCQIALRHYTIWYDLTKLLDPRAAPTIEWP